jgi:hypothetical protein
MSVYLHSLDFCESRISIPGQDLLLQRPNPRLLERVPPHGVRHAENVDLPSQAHCVRLLLAARAAVRPQHDPRRDGKRVIGLCGTG